MNQAEIEAELTNVRQQLSQLQQHQANQKASWRWLGVMSLGLSFVFAMTALIGSLVTTPVGGAGPSLNASQFGFASLPLLFLGLALLGDLRRR